MTELAHRRHGAERAGNELGRPIPVGRIGGLRLEEFSVGQDDSELVVQAVK